MGNDGQRKEVRLKKEVVENLQLLAQKKDWSIKRYMEWVLTRESNKIKK